MDPTYGSHLLSKAERQYCVIRRELLAAVFFTNQFHPYLLGRHFLLRTDHGALTWLLNFKKPEGQDGLRSYKSTASKLCIVMVENTPMLIPYQPFGPFVINHLDHSLLTN